MFGWLRSRRNDVKETAQVVGDAGFGFGPYHIVYDKRQMPDPGAPAVAFLTERLPIEQRSGPTFENRIQTQTVRRPGEMMVALQGFGLQVLGQPGIPAGYFALQPLSDISGTPSNIPIIANPPIGAFELPSAGNS